MSKYDYNLWVQRFCKDYGLSDVPKKQMLVMFKEYDRIEKEARIDELDLLFKRSLLHSVNNESLETYLEHRIAKLKKGL